MALDPSDPRSSLATMQHGATTVHGSVAAAEFYDLDLGSERGDGHQRPASLVRAQNMLVEYALVTADHPLESDDDPDESVVLTTTDDASVHVDWADESCHLNGIGFVAIPPGRHRVNSTIPTPVIRLFTPSLHDRNQRAVNAASYAEPHPNVTPLQPWPAPTGTPRLRRYRLADVAAQDGRFGNIFRTRAFMINFLPNDGPRDEDKLSPHAHDDFEQLSLAITGEWVHHIRTPWTPRKHEWRDDVHRAIGSPSIAIIPPPTIHTSQSVNPGGAFLIDLFSPPRADFSSKPGWVLNAADYPAPGLAD